LEFFQLLVLCTCTRQNKPSTVIPRETLGHKTQCLTPRALAQTLNMAAWMIQNPQNSEIVNKV
jgi:hypothetical protein